MSSRHPSNRVLPVTTSVPLWTPPPLLRSEGPVASLIALLANVSLDGLLRLLLVLALPPDLSIYGYLVRNRFGRLTDDVIHTYTALLILGTTAWLMDFRLLLLVALVWVGHIGADRMVGYGLKHATGFNDTHRSLRPLRNAAASEGESAP